ncbi:unnamed protein product, partial [Symbiodinium pilosum]
QGMCANEAPTMARSQDVSEEPEHERLKGLFDRYAVSEEQQDLFFKMRKLTNMPAMFHTHADDEQMLWAVLVGSAELPENPTTSDRTFVARKIEERLRNLEESERRFKWFSAQWTKPMMRQLIRNWFCGSLVICPELAASSGSPGRPFSLYVNTTVTKSPIHPQKGRQMSGRTSRLPFTCLWREALVLPTPWRPLRGLFRSQTCSRTLTGQNMTWRARAGTLTLSRMIAFHPDDKMVKFYEDMGARARKKWGFEQYATFADAVAGEQSLLPELLPSFVGGTYRIDVAECLRYLFRPEPEALALMEETLAEMRAANEIPNPKHMQ